jgi:hypothetical protein
MNRDSKLIFEAYLGEQSPEMNQAEEADKHDTELFKLAGDVYEAAPDIIGKVYSMGDNDFEKFLKFLGEVTKFRYIKKPTP